MKKVLVLLLLFISMQSIANPISLSNVMDNKNKKKSSKQGGIDKSRLLFGPGIGFGAAYRSFSINLSPSVAYCITDRFHVGTTLGFNYFQQGLDYNNIVNGNKEVYKYKLPAYSLSVYARYLVGNFLLLNFEPEINNTKYITNFPFNSMADYDLNTGKVKERSERRFIPAMLLGAGYAQRFGNYGYSYIMVCYDLVQNPNSRYYQTLDYRFGIMINLW
jgi:hypothetical protein